MNLCISSTTRPMSYVQIKSHILNIKPFIQSRDPHNFKICIITVTFLILSFLLKLNTILEIKYKKGDLNKTMNRKYERLMSEQLKVWFSYQGNMKFLLMKVMKPDKCF